MTKDELHEVYEWAVQTSLATKSLCASQSQYTMDCLLDDVLMLLNHRGQWVNEFSSAQLSEYEKQAFNEVLKDLDDNISVSAIHGSVEA